MFFMKKILSEKILPFLAAVLFPAVVALGFFPAGCVGKSDEEPLTDPSDGESLTDPSGGESLPYQTQRLDVQRGENDIYALLYLPVSASENAEPETPSEGGETLAEGARPAVILSHSSSLTADSLSDYAAGFAERGYIACTFDFCGGSSKSRSDGAQEDMTVFTEVEDLKAVWNAVRSLDGVNPDEIYLFGTSQGGLVSALTANDYADEIAGLILLYPGFSIAEQIQSFYGDSSGISASLGSSFMGTGEAYVQTLLDFDVYEHIGNFKNKVLILHGSKDFIVNPSYSERAAEIYENCELHLIEGASHGFNRANFSLSGDYDDQVWQYVDAFLGTS